jgi:hypothetical protein
MTKADTLILAYTQARDDERAMCDGRRFDPVAAAVAWTNTVAAEKAIRDHGHELRRRLRIAEMDDLTERRRA